MKIPHSSALTVRFPVSENYILFEFVQGKQSAVLHIDEECTVEEGAFVDVRIFGVGLKKELPDDFVDHLHGDMVIHF